MQIHTQQKAILRCQNFAPLSLTPLGSANRMAANAEVVGTKPVPIHLYAHLQVSYGIHVNSQYINLSPQPPRPANLPALVFARELKYLQTH